MKILYLLPEFKNYTVSSCKFSLYCQVPFLRKRRISPNSSFILTNSVFVLTTQLLQVRISSFLFYQTVRCITACMALWFFCRQLPSALRGIIIFTTEAKVSGKVKDCQVKCDRQMNFCSGVCPFFFQSVWLKKKKKSEQKKLAGGFGPAGSQHISLELLC